LYTAVPADKAAILPDTIPFTEGVVAAFAIEAAVCVLSVKQPGIAMPGVSSPALGLPYPSLNPVSSNKTLVVYGGSSSVGSMTTQLATAAGIRVISIASERNFDLCRRCGAAEVIDYNEPGFVEKVIAAVSKSGPEEFVGIFDAISTPGTYANDLIILGKLGGNNLACVHPPPNDVPEAIKAGMIFAVNDVATPVWRDYVTPALQSGKLKCLPAPTVVGKGLECIDEALKKCKAGVSATKLVVEL
jgi:NADPH:quinone reductase-like Zn-dependent oxidoreductase